MPAAPLRYADKMLSRLKWITLLSLDAPLVTVAWQALISKTTSSHQSWHHYTIVFLSVWLGYAADRWFDTLKRERPSSPQHSFTSEKKISVASIWILTCIIAISLSIATLTQTELTRGIILMCASLAYTLFAQKARRLKIYPFAKSAFTSSLVLAACLVFQLPNSLSLLAILAIWFLFLSNCLFIRNWDRPEKRSILTGGLVSMLCCFALGVATLLTQHPKIGIACLASATLLAGLNLSSRSHPLTSKRTLADLCLLSPLPLLLF